MRVTTAEELAEIIGPELMTEVRDRLGGQRIYIPTTAPDRHEFIAQRFDDVIGIAPSVMSAYQIVAQETDVAVRTVRRVVTTH
jgi:hypothetical protein